MRPSLIRSAVAIVDRTWGRPRQTVEHLGQPEVVGQGHRNARRSRAMRSRVGLGAKVLDLASAGAAAVGGNAGGGGNATHRPRNWSVPARPPAALSPSGRSSIHSGASGPYFHRVDSETVTKKGFFLPP